MGKWYPGTQKTRLILLHVNNLVLQINQIRQHQSPLPHTGKGLIGKSPLEFSNNVGSCKLTFIQKHDL